MSDVLASDVITTITLPWPPSTNNLYVNGRDSRTGLARRFLTTQAREWKQDAELMICLETGLAGGVVVPPGPLAIALWLHPPRRGLHFDADGKIKIVQDALAAALDFNDARIVDCHVTIGEPVPRGSVTVTLSAVATGGRE